MYDDIIKTKVENEKMIRKLSLLFALSLFVLSACQPQTTPEPTEMEGEAFELYLVAEAQMAGADLQNYELEELPLAEEPILTTEDIAQYDWESHTLDLTTPAYNQLLAIFSRGMPMSGVPFVIVSHGQRIYAGAFWSPASSLSFDGVVILQPADPTAGTLFINLGYPGQDFFTGEDPRDDPRLREALDNAGVLAE